MGQIKQVKCVYDTVSEPHMKKKKKTQIKLIITNGAACSQSDGYKFNKLKIKIFFLLYYNKMNKFESLIRKKKNRLQPIKPVEINAIIKL